MAWINVCFYAMWLIQDIEEHCKKIKKIEETQKVSIMINFSTSDSVWLCGFVPIRKST